MSKLAFVFLFSFFQTVKSSDLPTSFQQAVALNEAQDKVPGLKVYEHELGQYYQHKYSDIFVSCLKTTERADKSPFSFVAAIGKDGRVLKLYIDNETNVYKCVQPSLRKEEFPHPPLAPFYFHVSMTMH
jgi:hypothetical protein